MKTLLSIVGFLGIPFGLYLLLCTMRSAVTPWGWFWMLCYILFDLGFLWLGTQPRRAKIVLGIAGGLMVLAIGARSNSSRPTPSGILIRIPSGAPGPWSARLFEEADLAMLGFTVLSDFGVVRKPEHAVAGPLLRASYRRMRLDTDVEPIPSPLLPGLFGVSRGEEALAVVLNPPQTNEPAQRAVILLHGIGGALKLECYNLARQMTDAMVVCPDMGVAGDWTVDEAGRVFDQTIEYVRPRASVIYVVGLSSGAVGLEALLSRSSLGHVAGAVLVSGYEEARVDNLRRSQIPVLLIRGANDERTPHFDLHGQLATGEIRNEDLAGAAHYVFLEKETEVLDEIDEFCAAH